MKIEPILLTPEMVPKKWGYEKVLCNNEEFCSKILHFNKGAKFSCHFHLDKREVFVVQSGRLDLMFINLKDGSQTNMYLLPGMIVEIPRLLPHQIEALEESEILEVSTHHDDDDSFRVIPGDNQK